MGELSANSMTCLFWVEILLSVSRSMFGQAINLKALAYRFLHYVLQGTVGVSAELTRVGVMTVHTEWRG
jgi:hypothetical protein